MGTTADDRLTAQAESEFTERAKSGAQDLASTDKILPKDAARVLSSGRTYGDTSRSYGGKKKQVFPEFH